MAALPAGPISAGDARALTERYGIVANGYSPEQWQRNFGARGLDAKAFGAAWS